MNSRTFLTSGTRVGRAGPGESRGRCFAQVGEREMVRRMKRVLFSLLVIAVGTSCNKAGTSSPAGTAGTTGTPSTPANAALLSPSSLTEQAPATFRAKFLTTKGEFVVEVQREWAPKGADRFYNLVKAGFYDEVKFFRAIKDFMVQFGIHGQPAVARAWANANITDDPVKLSNLRGHVTFATGGPNTRTTQIFINLVNNTRLDASGFSAFGKVVTGMEVVDSLFTGIGEGPPGGRGPDQGRIEAEGNAYLERDYPQLDAVKTATIVP
jgi:peptidyl-prolyl cis-trans isomerase A (cyclophilin A)